MGLCSFCVDYKDAQKVLAVYLFMVQTRTYIYGMQKKKTDFER